jgi:sec-independent protein translocase protein TatC
MTKKRIQTKKKLSRRTQTPHVDVHMTFMDHVRELQVRLFKVAIIFLVAAAAAYPFADSIIRIIVAPFGEHELVYLTPGGAFGFVIQVCMYVGFIVALPMIVYQLYKFLLPVMPALHVKRIIGYTAASLVLAVLGILFAYFISLPAALYFLIGFDLENVSAMVTIDSYFSFAMAYLTAGALLFQLPVITLMIDTITPLTPKKLMGYQRHLILGAFIVAAVISPTPDALNQTLLAGPIIIMYQLSIVLVALRHRKRTVQQRRSQLQEVPEQKQPEQDDELPVIPEPEPHPSLSLYPVHQARKPVASRKIVDIKPVFRRVQPTAKKPKVMDVVAVPKKPTLHKKPENVSLSAPVAAPPPVPPPLPPAPKPQPKKQPPTVSLADTIQPRHRITVPTRDGASRRYQPFGPPRQRQTLDGIM